MRPYIICHMTTSIDGKVTGDFLNRAECEKATEEYFRLNREISAQAFACGRRTMKESVTGDWYPDLKPFEGEVVDREDFIANADAERYAVAFDRRGKLGWQSSEIEDEDFIETSEDIENSEEIENSEVIEDSEVMVETIEE